MATAPSGNDTYHWQNQFGQRMVTINNAPEEQQHACTSIQNQSQRTDQIQQRTRTMEVQTATEGQYTMGTEVCASEYNQPRDVMPRIKLISGQAAPDNTNAGNDNLLNLLSIDQIRLNKKSFRWHLSKMDSERRQATEAQEFVSRLKTEHEQFAGKMFLLKKKIEQNKHEQQKEQQEEQLRKKHSEKRRRISRILERLTEIEQTKQARKKDFEDFKHHLSELKNKKPLYQIKEEEYKNKVELPVLLQKQTVLQKIKQQRKPFDWKTEMETFGERIKEYRQKSQPFKPKKMNLETPHWYQSRFYKQVARFKQPDPRSLTKQKTHKKKKFSQEVRQKLRGLSSYMQDEESVSKESLSKSIEQETKTNFSLSKAQVSRKYRSRYSTLQDYTEDGFSLFRPRGLSIKTDMRTSTEMSIVDKLESPKSVGKKLKPIKTELDQGWGNSYESIRIEEEDQKLIEDIWNKMNLLQKL